jgi:hypothetical protein
VLGNRHVLSNQKADSAAPDFRSTLGTLSFVRSEQIGKGFVLEACLWADSL